MKVTPKLLKLMLNLYPPYLGTGIKIDYISEDWREIHTSLSLRWFNRNAVGTHFGGNLYSMIDPHVMLLLIQLLGKEYWVWDKSAEIEFIKASNQKVTSKIKIYGIIKKILLYCGIFKKRNRSQSSGAWSETGI